MTSDFLEPNSLADQLFDELKRTYYAGQKPEYHQLKLIDPSLTKSDYRTLVEQFIATIRERELKHFKEHEAQVQKMIPGYTEQSSWLLFFEQDITSRLQRFLMQRDHALMECLEERVGVLTKTQSAAEERIATLRQENTELKERLAQLEKSLQTVESERAQQEKQVEQLQCELDYARETEASHKRIIELLSQQGPAADPFSKPEEPVVATDLPAEQAHVQVSEPVVESAPSQPAAAPTASVAPQQSAEPLPSESQPQVPAFPEGFSFDHMPEQLGADYVDEDEDEPADPADAAKMAQFLSMASASFSGLDHVPPRIHKSVPEVQPERDVQRDAHGEDKSEPEVQSKVQSETKPEPQVQRKPQFEVQAEPEVQSKVLSETKPEPQVQRKSPSEVPVQPEVQSKDLSESKPEPQVQRKPQFEVQAEPEPQPEVQTELPPKKHDKHDPLEQALDTLDEMQACLFDEKERADLTVMEIEEFVGLALSEHVFAEEEKALCRRLVVKLLLAGREAVYADDAQLSDEDIIASITPEEHQGLARAALAWGTSQDKKKDVSEKQNSSQPTAQEALTETAPSERNPETVLKDEHSGVQQASLVEPQPEASPETLKPQFIKPTQPVDSQLKEMQPAQATASSYGLPTATPSLNISLPGAGKDAPTPLTEQNAQPAVLLNRSSPKALLRDESTLLQESKGKHGDENIAAFAAATARIESLAPLLSESGKELRQAKEEIDAILDGKTPSKPLDDKESKQTTEELTSVAQDIVKVAQELKHKPAEKKTSVFDNCFTHQSAPKADELFDQDGGGFVAGNSHVSDAEDSFVTGNTTHEDSCTRGVDLSALGLPSDAEIKKKFSADEDALIGAIASTLPLGSGAHKQELSPLIKAAPESGDADAVVAPSPENYTTISTGSTTIIADKPKPASARPVSSSSPVSTIISSGSAKPLTPSGKLAEREPVPSSFAAVAPKDESAHGSAIVGIDKGSFSFTHEARDSLNEDEQSRFSFLYRNLEHQIVRTRGELGDECSESKVRDFCMTQLRILDRNQYLTTRLRSALKEQLEEDLDPRRALAGYTVAGAEIRALRKLIPAEPIHLQENSVIDPESVHVPKVELKAELPEPVESSSAVPKAKPSVEELQSEFNAFHEQLTSMSALKLNEDVLKEKQELPDEVSEPEMKAPSTLEQASSVSVEDKDVEITPANHEDFVDFVDAEEEEESEAETDDDESEDDKQAITFAPVDFAAVDEDESDDEDEEDEVEDDDADEDSQDFSSSFSFVDEDDESAPEELKLELEAKEEPQPQPVAQKPQLNVVSSQPVAKPVVESKPASTPEAAVQPQVQAPAAAAPQPTPVAESSQPASEQSSAVEPKLTQPSQPPVQNTWSAPGSGVRAQKPLTSNELQNQHPHWLVKDVKSGALSVPKPEHLTRPSGIIGGGMQAQAPKPVAPAHKSSGTATALSKDMPQWVAPRAVGPSKELKRSYGNNIKSTDSTSFTFGTGLSSLGAPKQSNFMYNSMQSTQHTTITRTDKSTQGR